MKVLIYSSLLLGISLLLVPSPAAAAISASSSLSSEGIIKGQRQARQTDSTTEVVGLVLDREARDTDYKVLKSGARDVTRGRVSRFLKLLAAALPAAYKRAIPGNSSTTGLEKKEGEKKKKSRQMYTTRIQFGTDFTGPSMMKIFQAISHNYELAKALKDSPQVQSNPALKKMMRVSPTGIYCVDVCPLGGATPFGTLGICSNKYCDCGDAYFRRLELKLCDRSLVFDTLKMRCERPEDTVLCSDGF